MSETITPQPDAKVLTVPLNADGSIGTLPEPLEKFLGRRIKEEADRARKAADPPAADPVERERLRQLEAELHARKVADAEREKRYEDALKLREQEYDAKGKIAEAAIAARESRLRDVSKAEIAAAALKHGAREESLRELGILLGTRVTLTDTLDFAVLGDDGKLSPDTSIEAMVKAYLDAHPHHVRGVPGVGGGARGGASLAGTTAGTDKERTFAALAQQPTAENLTAAIRQIGREK